MIRLEDTVRAWATPEFEEVFKREVGRLDIGQLPLQQGLSQGSYASDRHLKVLVISAASSQGLIQVKAGIFYTGILPGCACSDDAAPESEYTEYCEVLFAINERNAGCTISLLVD